MAEEKDGTTCVGLIEHIKQGRLRQLLISASTAPHMENLEETLIFLLELTQEQYKAIMKLDRRVQQLEGKR